MTLPSLTLPQLLTTYRIPKDCILLYEREGLVHPSHANGERYYSVKDKIRIEVILAGKKLGFSLREIKSLIEAHLPAPGAPIVSGEKIKSQIAQLENEKEELQIAIDHLRAKTKGD